MEVKTSVQLATKNENLDNCVGKFKKTSSKTFNRKTFFTSVRQFVYYIFSKITIALNLVILRIILNSFHDILAS